MMSREEFYRLYDSAEAHGNEDFLRSVHFYENVPGCFNSEQFIHEAIWCVIASGIKYSIARSIEKRVFAAIDEGRPLEQAFRHPQKVKAIRAWLKEGESWFKEYNDTSSPQDKIRYLASRPGLGPITSWHMGKNLGLNVAKPDLHLVRIADHYKTDPQTLCAELSKVTGLRIATVDFVLFYAAACGVLDTKKL